MFFPKFSRFLFSPSKAGCGRPESDFGLPQISLSGFSYKLTKTHSYDVNNSDNLQ